MARKRWKFLDIFRSALRARRYSAADARRNSAGCYDLAIASLREKHERGEVIGGEYGEAQNHAERALHERRVAEQIERTA